MHSYLVKVKSYPWRVMTAFFASSHNTYSPDVRATRISQTCVKTVTYLIITWASLLWTTKSLSFSDFLSLLRLSSAAISCHVALQGPVQSAHLPHLSPSLISLHSRWKWFLYYWCKYWTMESKSLTLLVLHAVGRPCTSNFWSCISIANYTVQRSK